MSVAKRWPVRGRTRITGAVASNGDFGIARREALHTGAEGPIPAVRSRTLREHRLGETRMLEIDQCGTLLWLNAVARFRDSRSLACRDIALSGQMVCTRDR